MNPAMLLASPSGATGGGASVPSFDQQIKSSAASSLDSSGSGYDLRSATGDFSVGGFSNKTLLIIGGIVLVAIVLMRK